MISFYHQGKLQAVRAGDRWNSPANGESYHDAPPTELREIASAIRQGRPWREVVRERYATARPWLYRIVADPARDLFLRLHPPRPGERILDIGAGWGQVTLPLARRGDLEITALEPTTERLDFVEAAARQEATAERVHFLAASLFEVEFESCFDLACSIGVLEWVPQFHPGDPRQAQLDFLARTRRALAPDGQLVLGIENRLGLKYVLGARDDHTGVAGISVLDSKLAARRWEQLKGEPLRCFTFTRAELEDLLHEAGFGQLEFFAAFPDYKLPTALLSLGTPVEEFLLQEEIVPEHDGCDGSPLPFQEALASHYRSLARLGVASAFVPSFYVSARPGS